MIKENIISIKYVGVQKSLNKEFSDVFLPKLSVTAPLVNGKYDTGLTEEELEKYAGIVGESVKNLFYSRTVDSFWDNFTLKLEGKVTLLNIEDPYQYLKYKIALKRKEIANSLAEFESDTSGKANYYICNEVEEVNQKANKTEKIKYIFSELAKRNKEDKINLIRVVDKLEFSGASDNAIEVQLMDINNLTPDRVKLLHKYLSQDKRSLNKLGKVYHLLNKNVISREGNSYFYGDTHLGDSPEEVNKFLSTPSNNKLKIQINSKLDNI